MKLIQAFLARDVLHGALVTIVCTILSFVLALAGFGRLYYAAVFLPFFMLACLLVAWFLYLKDDGFIPSNKKPRLATPYGPAATSGLATDGGSSKASGSASAGFPELSLYAPRGDELVPRRSDGLKAQQLPTVSNRSGKGGPGANRGGEGRGAAGARQALLWAAVQLGLLAAALYSWAGVGAGYFIPVAR